MSKDKKTIEIVIIDYSEDVPGQGRKINTSDLFGMLINGMPPKGFSNQDQMELPAISAKLLDKDTGEKIELTQREINTLKSKLDRGVSWAIVHSDIGEFIDYVQSL